MNWLSVSLAWSRDGWLTDIVDDCGHRRFRVLPPRPTQTKAIEQGEQALKLLKKAFEEMQRRCWIDFAADMREVA